MKQVERFDASPIEQELAFRKWCEQRGVKLILMDGDDTLWKTVPVFRRQMNLCYDYLAQQGLLSRDEWKRVIEQENDRLFEATGVNPIRWNLVIDSVQKYGLSDSAAQKARNVLSQIYYTPLEYIDSTESGLTFLRKTLIPMGIVTHANKDWTMRKYNWLNLGRFFDWDDIYIVDENGHKTAESWLDSMRYFGVRPENCMVIGDSPRSDINPAISIGVRNCMLVQNGNAIWSVHQQPILDDDIVWTVGGINDLRWLGREIVHQKN